MTRSRIGRLAPALAASLAIIQAGRANAVWCGGIDRPFCTYVDDPVGFSKAAGALTAIDFETWPDGMPTIAGQQLTPEMNYTQIGVTFSSPVGNPFISSLGGFKALEVVDHEYRPDWITAEFVTPTAAVGIVFPGVINNLYAFGPDGNLIGAASFPFGFFGSHFLGIVSDVPIGSATVDPGSYSAIVDMFVFNPTPEATSVTLFLVGLALIAPTMRRHRLAALRGGHG